MQAQGRDFGLFVMEQTARLRFNRGLLLNAGALLLAEYGYDFFVFHDVDTLPTEAGAVPYDYPSGAPSAAPRPIAIVSATCTGLTLLLAHAGQAPLHLTPPGIHPKVRYEVRHFSLRLRMFPGTCGSARRLQFLLNRRTFLAG